MSEKRVVFFRGESLRRSKKEFQRIFPPLPEITSSGWYMIRQDDFLSVRGDLKAVKRFSLMKADKEQGYADILSLPASSNLPNMQCLTWIYIKKEHEGKTFGTQLLRMVEDYLVGTNAVGLLQDTLSPDRKGFFERKGWQKIPGTKSWRSYNSGSLSQLQLEDIINNSTLYLVDYERAIRKKREQKPD